MQHPFDPGYFQEPFLTLAADYPEAGVYPEAQFRVEWGPVFHRGRLDGWAKRAGTNDLAKRRNITITVPKGVVP
jgi:hypothetical protein